MPNTETYTASFWAAVTPSDSVPISPVPRAIHVGTGGTVVAKGQNGVSASFTAADGQTLEIQPVYVMSTGTTATGIVALY